MILPVITLYQPWATWIMRGWKTIETRTHNRFDCLERKTILIHAGKTTDKSEFAIENPYLTPYQLEFTNNEMINGFILGSAFVSVTDRCKSGDENRALIECDSIQRYGLFLQDIKKFKDPIPAKGGMGIWYFDTDKNEKVNKPKLVSPTLF